ncbi:hypothetical protein FB565_007530 [Actinoplanes lutulentus]|uniref:Uncharacterized protein n=1 Tax=Actinoplanes lutulentus TaxID=1287878 RepID=A0A327Z3M1_9ACTN|nr:hypothetical protein [Actinoplanes lutulentus]MBB2947759.1 hypothetical protein [Actinoplanes lutulentus]RAK29927.1 hypothetical protein B0I29_117253 [Actinoplanes lutulentus]
MQDHLSVPRYWDPIPHIDAVFASLSERSLRSDPEDVFGGTWEEWILRKQKDWGSGGLPGDEDVGAGLTDYLRYLDGRLADDLRCYLFFLDNGRGPAGERLPLL